MQIPTPDGTATHEKKFRVFKLINLCYCTLKTIINNKNIAKIAHQK